VSEKFALAMHIDFDEANACGLEKNAVGLLQALCAMHEPQDETLVIADKVITETRAKELCENGIITLRKGTIVTPSAKDVFNQRKCEVIFM